MRPLLITVAIAVIALAALAYPLARQTPSTPPADEMTRVTAMEGCPGAAGGQQDGAEQRGVGEISWFQGTLEEAFAHRAHSRSHRQAHALSHF